MEYLGRRGRLRGGPRRPAGRKQGTGLRLAPGSTEAHSARRRPHRGYRPMDGQHGGLRADYSPRLVRPRIHRRVDGPALGRRPCQHVAHLRRQLGIAVMHE